MREYSKHFYSNIQDVGRMRLIDFLQSYGEAVEDAKEQQSKNAPKMGRNTSYRLKRHR